MSEEPEEKPGSSEDEIRLTEDPMVKAIEEALFNIMPFHIGRIA